MICPYICDITQVNHDTYEYDENGNTTAHEHVLVERQTPMKCKAHECAAWAGGKCAYRGE